MLCSITSFIYVFKSAFSVFAVVHCFFFIIRVEEDVTYVTANITVVDILVMYCTVTLLYLSTLFFHVGCICM